MKFVATSAQLVHNKYISAAVLHSVLRYREHVNMCISFPPRSIDARAEFLIFRRRRYCRGNRRIIGKFLTFEELVGCQMYSIVLLLRKPIFVTETAGNMF